MISRGCSTCSHPTWCWSPTAAARWPRSGARWWAATGWRPSCPASTTVAPDAVVGTVWLNGAPGGRIDLAGELDTAVSLVVADGRITRIYAIRNPHKLARLDEEAALSR